MDRSLAALGLDDVAVERPLIYPGRPVTEPSLLLDDELLPLDVRATRLGDWSVDQGGRLDEVLMLHGQEPVGRRHPVISVGSNASPGQVRHKLRRLNLPVFVPMVPVRVGGIGVGCSGHISPAGYVAGTPFVDHTARTTLVVTWLDARQLKAVDDTEFPDYRRAFLPGDLFDMTMPSRERLSGAYIYFSAHGVLAPDGTRPVPGGGDQATLLDGLLTGSSRLRELLGPDAASWVDRAGQDQGTRAHGTTIFGEEGWVLPQTDFLPYLDESAELRPYDDLPPLQGSLPNRTGNG
ncbi:hypothetical protein [Streptomyces sp. NBC_01353]|uniref:hypothetical protein n=1 Tax=Streptomyces sp. NBC_01353 TaxID=2903835 RepID=UPI002E331D2E|nr:hypothetical protein [Streptomyces sp. NBC_01353]